MKITCISDLHGDYPVLNGGDLLIIAGDLTATDSSGNWIKFYDWLGKQPFGKKVYIAGNHDMNLQTGKVSTPGNCDAFYLQDAFVEIDGIKIYGTPWTNWFAGINPNCTAFTSSEKDISERFAQIPNNIDILITHSPPYRMLDVNKNLFRCGSPSLLKEVKRIKPKVHIFGHIHESYGMIERAGTIFINASRMNKNYESTNAPVEFQI